MGSGFGPAGRPGMTTVISSQTLRRRGAAVSKDAMAAFQRGKIERAHSALILLALQYGM
jgi:hypothetical protein